ncbi:hypothetical protein [Nocardioides zeae]
MFETQEVLRVWLLVRNGLLDAEDVRDASFGPWMASPVEEQAAWVRATYAHLRSCDLDRLEPPAPVAR